MHKPARIFLIITAAVWGSVLVFALLSWSHAAASASPDSASSAETLLSSVAESFANPSGLTSSCPVTTTIAGQLDPVNSSSQTGRLFRDGSPSTCSGEPFPGLTDEGSLFRYETFGPYQNYGSQDTCVVVSYDPLVPTGCGPVAHAVVYQNAYDPENQEMNYLADSGSSATQPFSFTLPAGESFMFVVQSTVQLISACDFAFTVSEVPCQETPLIEVFPGSLKATQLQETVVTHTLTISNHGLPDLDWSLDNTALWVDLSTNSGTTPANSGSAVQTLFDATGLAPGEYTSTVMVNSNDPTQPAVGVPMTMTVEPSVDLVLTKVDDPDPVYAGQQLTYTLRVTNTGVWEGTGILLTDTLPSEAVHLASNSSQGSCSLDGALVACNLGALSVGSSAGVTITISAPFIGGPMTNQAVVKGNETDPVTADNTATAQTRVIVPGDLALEKMDEPDPVYAGQPLTYTLTISNFGDTDTTGVILADTLPAGVTPAATSPSQGSCDLDGLNLTCSLGTIPGNGSAMVVVQVVAPPEGSTLLNQAGISGNEPDPNPANNSASSETTVIPAADLALVKLAEPDPVLTGELLTYTLQVSNLGASSATSVTLTDTLPVEVNHLSTNPSQGSCALAAETVSCDLGNLAAGTTAEVSIQVLAPAETGLILNQAEVSANEADLQPGNNTSLIETQVSKLADLALTAIDEPDPVAAGGLLTYTLTVQNNGPSTATGVWLTDVLPGGVTYLSSSASQGTCSYAVGEVHCNLGDLASGQSAIVTIQVMGPANGGQIVNEVTAGSNEVDPTPGNNGMTQQTQVIGAEGPIQYYLPIILKE